MASIFLLICLLGGCVTAPPSQVDSICDIFDEKKGWYDDARKSEKKWGTSIPVMMAIMHQESRFQPKAKPPRTKILWIFPGPRKSSAYGFPQAKDGTWDWYKEKAGSWGADRDDFGDAIDFIGWYNTVSKRTNRINLDSAYHLYLAYHEGHGGYNRGTYKKKRWLTQVASKVATRSIRYQRQLQGCEKRLQSDGWWIF